MPALASDRNLLLGVLAVQMDFVTQSQLVAAMNAWVLNKRKSLGRILLESGAIRPDVRMALEQIVDKHVELHGGAVKNSLAAMNADTPLKERIAKINDTDIDASLAHLSTGRPKPSPGIDPKTPPTLPMPAPAWESSGRFQKLRLHAEGGLGQVFVAFDGEVGREVALKEIREKILGHPEVEERFKFEAEITGKLEHPGIVPIYGMGRYADGRQYYAMRFVEGENYKDAIARFHHPNRIRSQRKFFLELRGLLRRFVDVCNVIEFAHSRSIVHRDIKPANVLLGKFGETLVVDWGLAKHLDEESSTEQRHQTLPKDVALTDKGRVLDTRTGNVLGTPGYMSPEQAEGDTRRLSPRSDIFSLGATLYCLLTGRVPFEGKDVNEVVKRTRWGKFPAPSSVNPRVPRALEAICLKALAHDPKDRYSTPKSLAADIESWLADEPVAVYRDPFINRLSRWSRRRRATVAAAFALAATATVGALAHSIVTAQANLNLEESNRTLHQLNLALAASKSALEKEIKASLNLAQDYALRGDWAAAAQIYPELPDDSPDSGANLQQRALLYLAAGNQGEYARLCELVQSRDVPSDRSLALSRALTLVLGNWEGLNFDRLLICQAAGIDKTSAVTKLLANAAAAAAFHRANKWADAVKQLENISAAADEMANEPKYTPVAALVRLWCKTFQASSHQKLQEKDKSQTSLENAKKLASEIHSVDYRSADLIPNMPRWTFPAVVEILKRQLDEMKPR